MGGFIPLSVPNLKGNEKKYVLDALEKEWVSTGGEYIDKLEENISKYLSVEKAVACQSGTAAIHLSLMESKVGMNDEVIVPALTFIATVNPVKYCNAYPIFMDCDDSLTLDSIKLEEFCNENCDLIAGKLINKKTGRHVKAIIVVHIFGNMANMEKIMEISKKYNLIVIEDATEALGTYYKEGKYKGKFAGTIGNFGCYSFNGNKIITTGGGGMIVSKSKGELNHIKYISTQAKDDTLHYLHDEIGYNYRMTNLQAAVGVAQFERLEEFIEVKKKNYNLYRELFNDIKGVRILDFNYKVRSNYWFYSLVLEDNRLDRDEMIKKLTKDKIQTRPIWGLINEQEPYKDAECYKIDKANYYHDKIINIPCSTNLKEEEVVIIVNKIKDNLGL